MWTQNKMYSREHNNNTIGYQSGISSRQLAKTWGASGTRSSAWGNLWNGFLITSLYRIPLYNSWLLKYLSFENSWVNPRVGSKGPHHFGFSPQGEIQSGRCDGPAVLAIKNKNPPHRQKALNAGVPQLVSWRYWDQGKFSIVSGKMPSSIFCSPCDRIWRENLVSDLEIKNESSVPLSQLSGVEGSLGKI